MLGEHRQASCLGRLDCVIKDRLRGGFPINLFAGPVSLGGHHACDGMSKSILDCATRLLAATQAFEPVGHVPERQIINPGRRQRSFTRQQKVFFSSLFLATGIIVRVAAFLD